MIVPRRFPRILASTVGGWLLSLLLSLLLSASALGARVIYCDSSAPPDGDGVSWETAYRDLHEAIADAAEGYHNQVWVAAGTYAPDGPGGDRAARFELSFSTRVYGGFAGDEARLEDRDPVANETILSGDLNGDDGPGFLNTSENSYRVVWMDNGIIDGFTITGGNAATSEECSSGAGIWTGYGPIEITRCTFRSNQACYGAALFVNSHGVDVTGCSFENNVANEGGGVWSAWSHEGELAILSDCVFTANEAHRGAAVFVEGWVDMVSCTLTGNTATGSGGAVHAGGSADLLIEDCTVVGNSAQIGGGLSLRSNRVTVDRTVVAANQAALGGGVYLLSSFSYGEVTFLDSIITGNEAVHGAGLYGEDARLRLVGCEIDTNEAYQDGGGVYSIGHGPKIISCTFDGNVAGSEGGGVYSIVGDPVIEDSLFLGNDAGGGAGAFIREGDPVLSDCRFESNTGHAGGGIQLEWCSEPSIERCAFVGNDCFTAGAMLIEDVASLRIEECAFAGNTTTAGWGGAAFIRRSGVTIERSAFTENTSDSDGGAIVAYTSELAIADTIFARNSATYDYGAIAIVEGDATIVRTEFVQNTGGSRAGALSCEDGQLYLADCLFDGNAAWGQGGAVAVRGSNAQITRCRFLANRLMSTTGGTGGALMIDGCGGSTGAVIDCEFTGNSTAGSGGAVFDWCEIDYTNCLFIGNAASAGGALSLGWITDARLVNCTLTGNVASPLGDGGGAVFVDGAMTAQLANCIVRGNTLPNLRAIDGGTFLVSYSNIEHGWPGHGNLDEDPLFVDPVGPDGLPGTGDENLRLGLGSRCIDAGDNGAVPAEVTSDLDGLPRHVDDAATPDTGHGDPPIVDMGPYEYQVACAGDANGDGAVDMLDLLLVLSEWGEDGGNPADLDGSGVVDHGDLIVVISWWGAC